MDVQNFNPHIGVTVNFLAKEFNKGQKVTLDEYDDGAGKRN
jgi:hypothetical protein